MTFDDLVFNAKGALRRGQQACHTFPNGYGVSVIDDGYGAEQGLYELAVLYGGRLCYSTPITDSVLGWLTEEDVTRLLGEVEALTERESA